MHALTPRLSIAALAASLALTPAAFAQGPSAQAPEADAPTAETAPSAAPAELRIQRAGDEEDASVSGATDRTVWIGGRSVDIDAIAPDVFAAGETLNVRGHVLDNLIGAGRAITLDGPVDGDAFLLGETLILNADVAGDLYAVGESLRIPTGVRVGGNLYFGGADLSLDGAVGGNLLGGGASFDIAGSVGGDVQIEAARLVVGPAASIGGNLEYSSPEEGSVAAGATAGSVDWTKKAVDAHESKEHSRGSGLGVAAFFLIGSLLIGAVLLGLFPNAITRPAALLEADAPVSLGVGFAVLLGVPVLALFLAVFILPIPLSLLAMTVYVPATVLARFIAAFALGGLLLQQLGKSPKPLGALFAGLIALHLAYAIPLLGGLVMMLATVLGLGALFLTARKAGARA